MTSSRREFLKAAAAMGAVLAWPSAQAHPSRRPWAERRDLYPLGVASGDPAADSVVLWTRRQATTPLTVEIAEDQGFAHVVSTASLRPSADNDWTVRVLAAGLKPATTYWYRFADMAGNGSRIGRTRTAPAANDDRAVSFAFVSCQNENLGANNAYRRMIFEDAKKPESEQLGFVLHLGDFFYEMVWYPEDKKTYYARTVRDIVRYPKGEKHSDFHVPVDVDDYRSVFRAYLADPDLADARARFPFVCMWDNHEFSWQGWQTVVNYGKDWFAAQTRKVAAAKAWFEYQPARMGGTSVGNRAVGTADWNRFDAPKVADAPVAAFDEHGLGTEANNLAAIHALRLYRALNYGANVDVILTDNRSFRSQSVDDLPGAELFGYENFPSAAPFDALEIIDAGKTANGGNPPDTIRVDGKDIPNWCKDRPAQTMLGKEQKTWFLATLAASKTRWKVWGNSVGSLDARIDFQNQNLVPWPDKGYATITTGDWSGYRQERGEIYDFVKAHGITGFTSVAGDRHSFWAGLLSKRLPPQEFEPVGIEFVTGSVSAPGFLESMEYKFPKDHKLAKAYVPNINRTVLHGIQAGLGTGAPDPAFAPHLKFMDWGGHGYTVVRASPDALEAEFVCIPRPIERAAGDDGGPLRYRVRHRARLWQAGGAPALEQTVVEGDPGTSI
ncbi:MAG: alkaline phosphatase D family protein [Alphaproteobacteria bacterium]|nr:alkaline phosphatase D family protein [Alphaproteobacteria bacterium]